MNINYCAIVKLMEIYPDDLRRIVVLLETVLFPTNKVDQYLMSGITNFMREKLVEYENRQQEHFSDLLKNSAVTGASPEGNYTVSWTTTDEEDVDKTEVTVAPDFPYPEGTAEKKRASKKAKKRKAK